MLDLIDLSNQYSDWPTDAAVIVMSNNERKWRRGHFVGVNREGNPMTWPNGTTSWTAADPVSWDQARRVEDQQLNLLTTILDSEY